MLLRSFLQDRRGAVAPIFALAIIPVIIVYVWLQEHIIRGVTLTGLKG